MSDDDQTLRARLYAATHRAGLDRLRWDIKLRHLRHYGPRSNPSRAVALRYLLLDPELDNFTYPLSNEAELADVLAAALGRDRDELLDYVREPEVDAQLQETLRAQIRWRPRYKRRIHFGRRLGWYAAVRAAKPALVAETGVHDGLGSLLLLRALERNASEGADGALHSFDVKPHAGWLVPETMRSRWTVTIGSTFDALDPALAGRQVDVFIHDSDHSYECEHHEFATAVRHRAPTTVLISDNAHATSALKDIAAEHGAEHHLFMERPCDHFYPGAGMGVAVLLD